MGFANTIKTLLVKPRVQQITIDARGKVSCRRYIQEDDDLRNSGIDFEDLSPASIVRNTIVEEVPVYADTNAAVVVGALFDTVISAQLTPIAFVSGLGTTLWDWYKHTTGTQLRSKDTLHGLPLYTDRAIPDTLYCYRRLRQRRGASRCTQHIKIEMPTYDIPETTVNIL